MSAIENCRTAALGGHVDACEDCGHQRIASQQLLQPARQAQGAAARSGGRTRSCRPTAGSATSMSAFTLPAEVADIAGQNKAIVYDLLFRAASETMMT